MIETHFITNCNVCYFHFWATLCKKRFALCHRTVVLSCRVVSVLSVTLVYCGQTVRWIKIKLGMVVGRGPGHTVLDGDPGPSSPSPKGHSPPNFRFMPIVAKRPPISATAENLYISSIAVVLHSNF